MFIIHTRYAQKVKHQLAETKEIIIIYQLNLWILVTLYLARTADDFICQEMTIKVRIS